MTIINNGHKQVSPTTPEDWFRTRQKDLYELCRIVDKDKDIRDIVFDLCSDEYFNEVEVLFKWFAVNLKNVMVDYCLPSEYSRIINGPSLIVADLDAHSLEVFNKACSRSDFGWMVAKVLSYEDWLARISRFQVLPAPMSSRWCAIWRHVQRLLLKSQPSLVPQQKVMWWDTPDGFVLVSGSNKNELPSEADAWWIYQQQEPKMIDVNFSNYPHGEFNPKTWQSTSNIVISYDDNDGEAWNCKAYRNDYEQNNLLRQAFGITEKASVEMIVGGL